MLVMRAVISTHSVMAGATSAASKNVVKITNSINQKPPKCSRQEEKGKNNVLSNGSTIFDDGIRCTSFDVLPMLFTSKIAPQT